MKILKEYRFKQNPLEEEFVNRFTEDYGSLDNMSRLVFGTDERGEPKEWLEEREEDIVLATIQWLGSPVGQGFLNSLNNEKLENN